ncbi:PH domain-containing protein [Lysobacter humi (ex Lee et al. 2017)]
MSWLFVLLQQMRQFIAPLVALVFFGRGDRNELWPLIGVAALVVVAIWRYFTYRFAVFDDHLQVRSGLLERSARTIPFARIQNVALRQSVLHRVFGVAEVKLESAGGKRPEAEMRVLALDDALALEALVRRRGVAAPAEAEATVEAPPATPLLRLSTAEVLRLGLLSNRGLVVAIAGAASFTQFGPDAGDSRFVWKLLGRFANEVTGYGGAHGFEPLDYAVAFGALALALLAALRLLSVLLALAQYHGFELREDGARLVVERGLLARWRSSLSRRRIQAWTLREGWLHRRFGRRALQVDIATGGEPDNGQRTLHELAPIATPAACDGLIEHLLPTAGWATPEWHPAPPAHFWRLALPETLISIVAAIALTVRFGTIGLLPLLWIPVALLVARRRIRHMAHAWNGHLVRVRDGAWSRTWRFAEVDALQAIEVARSPLDRRLGTATLRLDTAGAGMNTPPLHVRFLPVEAARALQSELAGVIARRRLRW